MDTKGFTENTKNIETPNDIDVTEKPLNSNKICSGRVDINILKSKLHRAIITDVHLDYEGSCAIDENILNASGINEYEMIHIYNCLLYTSPSPRDP